MQEIKEGNLLLCTVDRIIGTTVFVKLEDNREGTIITAEIAPGRIRNLRDYVVPGKKIVCMVLRVDEKTGHIDLSLRRVSAKARAEILNEFEKERNAKTIIKTICKEKSDEIIKKIFEKYKTVSALLYSQDESMLKEFFSEPETERIIKIVSEKHVREIEERAEIKLSCMAEDGISRIKKILSFNDSRIEIIYSSAPNYIIKVKAKERKEVNLLLDKILHEIELNAKEKACSFEIMKK